MIISARDIQEWREALHAFERVDVCQMPEYHLAYAGRTLGSQPVMWQYTNNDQSFCYPFLLTPVVIECEDTGFQDITSIYGYSGPLCNSDSSFLEEAWAAFDEWAVKEKILAEFVRFSLYAENQKWAHPATEVEVNRPSAISYLPEGEDELMSALGKKTRNMIRKALNSGLRAEVMDLKSGLPDFRALYEETMDRNDATDFFSYDNAYYETLLSLPEGEIFLIGVFHEDRMVASAIALVHGKGALYHLGASLPDYARLGAGNLSMFEMSKTLMERGVEFLTVGGGRTTDEKDPLFRFKKSNATDVAQYHIGKRVVNPEGYAEIVKAWESRYNTKVGPEKLVFYR